MSTDLIMLFETFKKEDIEPMCRLWVEFTDMVQIPLYYLYRPYLQPESSSLLLPTCLHTFLHMTI